MNRTRIRPDSLYNSVNVVRFAFKWSIPNNTTADSQSLRFTGNNYALKCTVKCWLLARLQPVGALRNPLHYSPVMRTQRMENADVSRSSCRRVLFASLKAPLLNQQHFLCCFGGALKSSSEGASSAGRAEQQLSLSLAFTGIVAQSVLLMFFAFYPQSQTNDSREERWNRPAGTVVSSVIWHKWIKIIRAGGGMGGTWSSVRQQSNIWSPQTAGLQLLPHAETPGRLGVPPARKTKARGCAGRLCCRVFSETRMKLCWLLLRVLVAGRREKGQKKIQSNFNWRPLFHTKVGQSASHQTFTKFQNQQAEKNNNKVHTHTHTQQSLKSD